MALGVGDVQSGVGRGLFSQCWVPCLGAACPAQATPRGAAPKQCARVVLGWQLCNFPCILTKFPVYGAPESVGLQCVWELTGVICPEWQ